jgi:hypothetical protein
LHLAAELYKLNTAEVFLTQGAERRPGALQRNYRHGGGNYGTHAASPRGGGGRTTSTIRLGTTPFQNWRRR